MSLECTNKGILHSHVTVSEVLSCYGLITAAKFEEDLYRAHRTSGPPKTPPARPATGPLATATEAQVNYIEGLGGDVTHAAKMTRGEASDYITLLKTTKGVPAPIPAEEEEKPLPDNGGMDYDMLSLFQEKGYFAVRLEANDAYIFFYVSRPKNGKYKGTIKVQQQHGSGFGMRHSLVYVAYDDSKKVYTYKSHLKDHVMIAITNQAQAMRDYAEQARRCCRCNAELTDARSLYYGIGPECEKSNLGLIEDIGLAKGFFEEQPK